MSVHEQTVLVFFLLGSRESTVCIGTRVGCVMWEIKIARFGGKETPFVRQKPAWEGALHKRRKSLLFHKNTIQRCSRNKEKRWTDQEYTDCGGSVDGKNMGNNGMR
jgi:hypothetical protein